MKRYDTGAAKKAPMATVQGLSAVAQAARMHWYPDENSGLLARGRLRTAAAQPSEVTRCPEKRRPCRKEKKPRSPV